MKTDYGRLLLVALICFLPIILLGVALIVL